MSPGSTGPREGPGAMSSEAAVAEEIRALERDVARLSASLVASPGEAPEASENPAAEARPRAVLAAVALAVAGGAVAGALFAIGFLDLVTPDPPCSFLCFSLEFLMVPGAVGLAVSAGLARALWRGSAWSRPVGAALLAVAAAVGIPAGGAGTLLALGAEGDAALLAGSLAGFAGGALAAWAAAGVWRARAWFA